jgi:TfoX/Sxy family transcriptional regulator of competence genes
MKWIKAPEALKKLLDDAMAGIDCEKRPMFGYPAYFINRNMFTGLFQDQLFVRLSADHLGALLKKYPSIRHLEPMPGRPMKDYFVLPRELYGSPRALREAIDASVEHTRRLAPKAKSPRKTASKKTSLKKKTAASTPLVVKEKKPTRKR